MHYPTNACALFSRSFGPELDRRWGYLVVWIVMLAICLFMLIRFRRKKWL